MMKFFYALAAAALFCVACVNEPAPPAAPAAKSGPLSAYAAQVDAALYPAAPAAAPVNFAWDFSKPKSVAYTLKQSLDSATGAEESKLTKRSATVTGMLTIAPETAQSGRATYSLMAAEHGSDGSETRRTPMAPPPAATIAPDTSGADTMTRLMLPLPGKTLKPGESASFNVTLPVRAAGMPVPVPAAVTVTYAANGKRGDKTFARLDYLITPGDFTPPANAKSEFAIGVSGTGRCYFDAEEGRVFESWTALRFTLAVKTPRPLPGDKKAPPLPEFDTFHLDSDNFFRLLKSE